MGGGQKAESVNLQNLAMPEELEISALRLRCDLLPPYPVIYHFYFSYSFDCHVYEV